MCSNGGFPPAVPHPVGDNPATGRLIYSSWCCLHGRAPLLSALNVGRRRSALQYLTVAHLFHQPAVVSAPNCKVEVPGFDTEPEQIFLGWAEVLLLFLGINYLYLYMFAHLNNISRVITPLQTGMIRRLRVRCSLIFTIYLFVIHPRSSVGLPW